MLSFSREDSSCSRQSRGFVHLNQIRDSRHSLYLEPARNFNWEPGFTRSFLSTGSSNPILVSLDGQDCTKKKKNPLFISLLSFTASNSVVSEFGKHLEKTSHVSDNVYKALSIELATEMDCWRKKPWLCGKMSLLVERFSDYHVNQTISCPMSYRTIR